MQTEIKADIFNIQKFSLHDGDGIRTCVFFRGCNLKCAWCANPEAIYTDLCLPQPKKHYTVDEVVAEVMKDKLFYDKSGGGVTLTGGEVFLQQDFAELLCDRLKEKGICVAMETAGAVSHERFVRLADRVDQVLIDFKHYETAKHRTGTGSGNELIIENIRYLSENNKNFIVRIPVIPGFNDSLEDAGRFCGVLPKMGVTRVHLLPFHQYGEKKYENLGVPYLYKNVSQIHREDLTEYRDIFIRNGIDTLIGG